MLAGSRAVAAADSAYRVTGSQTGLGIGEHMGATALMGNYRKKLCIEMIKIPLSFLNLLNQR